MNLNEHIDRRKAYLIIGSALLSIMILGTLFGKLLFWEKYDTRSTGEKNLERYRNEALLNPDKPSALVNLGWAYLQQGDVAKAETEYRKAIKINPQHLTANYNLGTVMLAKGKFREAENFFRKVISLDSKHLLAITGLGESLRLQKKYPEAEQVLNRALVLDKTAADIICELGLLYEQWGRKEQAIQHYKKAVNLLPDYSEAKAALKRLGIENYEADLSAHGSGQEGE